MKVIYNLVCIKIYCRGKYKIKSTKEFILGVRTAFVFFLSLCLILPGLSYSVYSLNDYADVNEKIIGTLAREIEILPGSDYYIRFFSNNFTLEGKNIAAFSSGLSEKIKDAIAKSPKWIQRELTRQFHAIDGEEYANLILEMSKRYVDEIAFSIACSSIGKVPSIDIIRENVLILYKNDELLKYADIVDYDDDQGNYYSTIKYRVIENDIVKQLEFPPEIYYWYVVHPKIISKAEYIYGKFWRDYLFNHNDLGYPLLKEKLSEINYLWDCESYSQPGQRLWKWSMENHPTAIEAISYWIGKTVPEQAYGDRPGQPNVIAHEHNGWCGELQRIAVAAQRTALVPSVGIFNIGEDHVWREFYERGWHENDNWWADGGGAVDKPDVYAYGWGKDMSAIFAKKGDNSIYEVTSTYIRPEDRKTVCFQVLDRRFHPIDGARVTVTVWGPNDITGIKYKFFEIVEILWGLIPPLLRGRILQFLFNKVKERINRIPDSVDGPIHSIWDYTDMDGKCCFELGQNRSYIFIIQHGNLRDPLRLAKQNSLRILKNPVNKTYFILFPFLSPLMDKHSEAEMPSGEISFKVSFDTESYQVQEGIRGNSKGVYKRDGKIDFFIVDENNFNKYREGRSFKCYNYMSSSEGNIVVNAQENNWYLVFRNEGRETNFILNFSVTVEMSTLEVRVQIVSPDTSIFDVPVFNIGETVIISGIATNGILLYIDGLRYAVTVQDYKWFYEWDTSGLEPGDYLIMVECGDAKDEILIRLIDIIPPLIKINKPFDNEIAEAEMLTIEGHTWDNLGVERVEVSLDNGEWREATGTDYWYIDWNISSYGLGDHMISARAFDTVGGISVDEISIVINESGHGWGPQINIFYHQPDNPTNMSNVAIYANVTIGSPFTIQRVVLYWDDGMIIKSGDMYRYGDNPIQGRHEEDPLKNMSNDPIFGLELGQFSTSTNITYWIGAFDTANNTVFSSKKSFRIEGI
jgi:hypothetical protein